MDQLLTDEALDFSRRHLTKYYDTDFFPKPFEFNAIWYKWDELKRLPRAELARKLTPIAIPWKKGRGGFRVVHQLDPLDAIVYTAMTYSVANDIEKKRLEQNSDSVCSYRIHLDGAGFFTRGSGFETYRGRCERFAEIFAYVLMTDISDFYNQIYLHRLENAISDVTNSDNGKCFERFLMDLNTKNSQGIPVGPAASIILSEAALIDVDEFISSQGFNHVRYVDDIRIFGDSEIELDILLQRLTLYLHHSHRLGLVGDKTKIIKATDFLQQELNNQYQLEKLEILDDIESNNHYSSSAESEYDSEDDSEDDESESNEPIGGKLLIAFKRIEQYEHLDLGLARAILRRARLGKHEEILDYVLSNLRHLRPVLNDVVLYIEAVTNSNTLESIKTKLRELVENGELIDSASQEWFGWYIGNHDSLSRDLHFSKIFENPQRLSNQARAAIKAKKTSWVRQKKESLLSEGPWNRRAIIFAAQILTRDEKESWLKSIKRNKALDIIDKWMIDWVLDGMPVVPPLVEPVIVPQLPVFTKRSHLQLGTAFDDFDDDIPF